MTSEYPSEFGDFPRLERPREAYRYAEPLDGELLDAAFERTEFVRHVITPYKGEGAVGRLQGSINVLLPDRAIETAVRSAREFAADQPAPLRGIYSPELARAYYTAAIYEGVLGRAGKLAQPLKVFPELNEFNFGDWQGRLIGEELRDDPDHMYWQEKPLSASLEGCVPTREEFVDFLQRINFAMKEVARDLPDASDARSLIVTCGMAWRATRYLQYLAEQGVDRLVPEQIEPHEYRFFNTERGRFMTLGYAGNK